MHLRSGGIITSQALVMSRRLTLVVAPLLASATTAFAQLSFQHNPKKDPYRHLFGERDPAQKTTPRATVIRPATPQKPFVVCGTLVVPADPNVDSKMRVGPPDDRVEHKLRIVPPPMCKPG
jgi:hypothetical protein